MQGEKRALIVTKVFAVLLKRETKKERKSECLLMGCTVTWIPTPIHMMICFFFLLEQNLTYPQNLHEHAFLHHLSINNMFG